MGELIEAQQVAPGVWDTIQPGVYDKVPNEIYQASLGTSKSHLDDMDPEQGNTPLHYWAKRVDPDRLILPKSDALIVGDAIHKAILEPDLFHQNIAELPEDAPSRPTKAMLKAKSRSASSQDRINWWADWDANHDGQISLKNADYQAVLKMRDVVHLHPTVKQHQLLSGGKAEQTFYAIDPVTGALIKCRTDYELLEREAMVLDVKSTEDASPAGFYWSVKKYRYDVQDAWYRHTIASAFERQIQVRKFIFLAIEKTWPYATGIHWIDPNDLPTALDVAHRDHARILDCRATNTWPDHGCEPTQLRRLNRSL